MNQTVKADAGKPRLTLVPMQILFDIAEVREYGNAKYPEGGPDNWKRVEPERYREAMLRHMLAYIDDPEGIDEESGIKHLKHLACNVAFLCWMEEHRDAIPDQTLADIPDQTLADIPDQTPEQTPADIPEQTPDTPCPDDKPDDTPVDTPDDKPDDVPGTASVTDIMTAFESGDVMSGMKRVIRKRCKQCGSIFEAGSNRAILCPVCKAKKGE